MYKQETSFKILKPITNMIRSFDTVLLVLLYAVIFFCSSEGRAAGESGNSYSSFQRAGPVYLEAADSQQVGVGSEFSVSFWVRVPEADQDGGVFVAKYGATGSWFFGNSFGSQGKGKLRMVFCSGSGKYSSNAAIDTYSSKRIATGEWVHCFIGFNKGKITLFLDGQEESYSYLLNAPSVTSVATTTAPIMVGSLAGRSGATAEVDDLSVWNRVLTPQEVISVFNYGHLSDLKAHPAQSALLGWWRLGRDLADQKGMHHMVERGGTVSVGSNHALDFEVASAPSIAPAPTGASETNRAQTASSPVQENLGSELPPNTLPESDSPFLTVPDSTVLYNNSSVLSLGAANRSMPSPDSSSSSTLTKTIEINMGFQVESIRSGYLFDYLGDKADEIFSSFRVVSNSNPSLVKVHFHASRLMLHEREVGGGDADITVEGIRKNGRSKLMVLHVKVVPTPIVLKPKVLLVIGIHGFSAWPENTVPAWLANLPSSVARAQLLSGLPVDNYAAVPVKAKAVLETLNRNGSNQDLGKHWLGSRTYLSLNWSDLSNDGINLLDGIDEAKHHQVVKDAARVLEAMVELRCKEIQEQAPGSQLDVLIVAHSFGSNVARELVAKLNHSPVVGAIDFAKLVLLDPVAVKPPADTPEDERSKHDRWWLFHPECSGFLDSVTCYYQSCNDIIGGENKLLLAQIGSTVGGVVAEKAAQSFLEEQIMTWACLRGSDEFVSAVLNWASFTDSAINYGIGDALLDSATTRLLDDVFENLALSGEPSFLPKQSWLADQIAEKLGRHVAVGMVSRWAEQGIDWAVDKAQDKLRGLPRSAYREFGRNIGLQLGSRIAERYAAVTGQQVDSTFISNFADKFSKRFTDIIFEDHKVSSSGTVKDLAPVQALSDLAKQAGQTIGGTVGAVLGVPLDWLGLGITDLDESLQFGQDPDGRKGGGPLGFFNAQCRSFVLYDNQLVESRRLRHLDPLMHFSDAAPLTSVDYAVNGRLATADRDGLIEVFEPGQVEPVSRFSCGSVIHSLKYSPDGAKIAVTTKKGSLKVLDAYSLTVVWQGNQTDVRDIIWIDGSLIASGGDDGRVKWWSLMKSGEYAESASYLLHTGPIEALASNGSLLISSGSDNRLVLSDSRRGILSSVSAPSSGPVLALSGGQTLFGAGNTLFKTSIVNERLSEPTLMAHFMDPISALAKNARGDMYLVACAGINKGSLAVYSITGGDPKFSKVKGLLPVRGVAFNPADPNEFSVVSHDQGGGPVKGICVDDNIKNATTAYQRWLFPPLAHIMVPSVYLEEVLSNGAEPFLWRRFDEQASRPGNYSMTLAGSGSPVGQSAAPIVASGLPGEVTIAPWAQAISVNLRSIFSASNSALELDVSSSRPEVLKPTLDPTREVAFFHPIKDANGRAIVTITARNSAGSASYSFSVLVQDTSAEEVEVLMKRLLALQTSSQEANAMLSRADNSLDKGEAEFDAARLILSNTERGKALIEAAMDAEKAAFKSTLNQLEKDLDNLVSRRDSLRDDQRTTSKKLDNCQSDVKALQRELNSCVAAVQSALAAKNRATKKQLADAEKAYKSALQKASNASNALSAAQSRMANLQNDLSSIISKLEIVMNSITSVSADIDYLKQTGVTRKYEGLRGEYIATLNQLRLAQDRLSLSVASLEDARKALSEANFSASEELSSIQASLIDIETRRTLKNIGLQKARALLTSITTATTQVAANQKMETARCNSLAASIASLQARMDSIKLR